MLRSVIAAIAVAGILACASSGADDKDPVKEKLFAAKVAYDKEMRQYRAHVGEWFDKREDAARKGGNKKLVDQIKVERKAFDEEGELPKGVPATIKQKQVAAKKALEAAYAQAVKEYVKAKKDDEAAAVEKEWKEFSKGNTIDLLALVDPKLHTISGEWKWDGKTLVGIAGAKQHAALRLQYEPGEEYDIEVNCKRIAGECGFGVGLLAGERRVNAVFDFWPQFGYKSGLSPVDMKWADNNVTTVKGQLLKPDNYSTLACSVRSGEVVMRVNGKVVTSFKGAFTRLPLRNANSRLYIEVDVKTSFEIDRVVVTPVKGKGKILK